MIKAIIFDCFGVLTTDRWKEFVATLPEELVQPARGLNHAYDAGFLTEEQFVQQIHELTGREPEKVEATLDNETNKNHELLKYIADLKTNYKIGLISNIASNWIREEFLNPEELKLFDYMVLSFEVHLTKPDSRIFQLAAQKLGVEPQECVLIDDIDSYCQASRDVGMQAVVYQNFNQTKQDLEKLLAKS